MHSYIDNHSHRAAPFPVIGRAGWFALALALGLHAAVAWGMLQAHSRMPPTPDINILQLVRLAIPSAPVVQPVEASVPEPVKQSRPQPVAKPVPTSVPKPRPEQKTVQESVKKPVHKVAQKPVQKPVTKPIPESQPVIQSEPAQAVQPMARQPSKAPAKPSYQPVNIAAAYADNPPLHYPRVAQRRGWAGVVVLRVKVGSQGEPIALAVATSSGYAVLDEAAIRQVQRWRFRPAKRQGHPVIASVLVPIQFKLET